jgi:transcription-repair coupling factor (superfamily II helicase)
MVIQDIINDAHNTDSIKNYLNELETSNVSFLECRSSMLPILSKLINISSENDVLIISATENTGTETINWINNLTSQHKDTMFFPQKKEHGKNLSKNSDRIEFISNLRKASSTQIIVSTLISALESLPSPSKLLSKSIKIINNDSVNLKTLSEKLTNIGFENKDHQLESKGEYTIRGGIVDIFSYDYENPIRIELFGDTVESIKEFDVNTHITIKELNEITIESIDYNLGSDYENQSSLFEYLKPETIVILDNPDIIFQNLNDHISNNISLKNNTEKYINQFSIDEIKSLIYKFKTINITQWKTDKSLNAESLFNISSIPVISASIQNNKHFTPLNDFDGKIIIQTSYINRTNELINKLDLKLENIDVQYTPPYKSTPGFVYKKTMLIGDRELYGTKYTPTQFKNITKEIIINDEVKPGDYVVHYDHGIGKFIDFGKPPKTKTNEDFMIIEYLNEDKLYVPLAQIHKISPYIAPTNKVPKLNSLGSEKWTKSKQKAQESALKWARELLSIYAERELTSGIKFNKDNDWEKDLEGSFPFKETPDQLSAINLVKNKMQNKTPMDVLICGDVGFGKTEVAIRAAFKAVCNGKQVAVISPTTILTQQHFETFKNRLSAFPVSIEYLSRFKSNKDQKSIIKDINNGNLDICIGTHRLIQNDIEFKNIGLLIIDEEQRFGVKQKENIKSKYPNVDIITMTATPIPRTLYMAISGIKDLYSINTPPEQRLPVETIINAYDENLIKQSITQELNRGGQVFFLHNRVETIQIILKQLKNLIPNANISVAHGQMKEFELEKTMLDFANKKIDILCCTTIIESGLDLPNVNTLIVNNAHRFGLSQLYQLRGRVGRSEKQGYSYFLIPKQIRLTYESEKRLQALEESVELGSGYKIAMRDLEIRGAGNILGKEQSGYVISIGLHLYSKLISEAKNMLLKNEKPLINEFDLDYEIPNIQLNLHLEFGDNYISEQKIKFELYKRLNLCQSLEEIESMKKQITNRYGKLYPEGENVIFNSSIQILAKNCDIKSITKKQQIIEITFHQLSLDKSLEINKLNNKISFISNKVKIEFNEQNWKKELLTLLQNLSKSNE